MNRIFFLQSKFPANEAALFDLLGRWENYGKNVRLLSADSRISVIALGRSNDRISPAFFTHKFESIELFDSSYISSHRVFPVISKMRRIPSGITLVCSDNQKSLLTALLLKIFVGTKLKIQIQFHGDTYSFRFNKGVRGFIRVVLSRLGILFSNSIRIVSNFQKEEIREIFPKALDRFVVAPIPMDYSRIAAPAADKTIDLAFIGRLHHERGISELINILKLTRTEYPGIKIAIAGDGPSRQLIENKLSYLIRDGSLSLLGHLSGESIQDLYSKSKVLISPAPREGYGLTIREAAMSGVYVIARLSKGSLDAQRSFPDSIKTYETTVDAVESILNAVKIQENYFNSVKIEMQKQIDSDATRGLVTSWLCA